MRPSTAGSGVDWSRGGAPPNITHAGNDLSAWPIPHGFAGGLLDTDTGLVRFGARDYDPSVGRWTAKDPILFEGGQANLYVYVRNNPVSFFDPVGTDVWIEGASGGEPYFHQSINIGDPFGDYRSFSFAINDFGRVYEDSTKGGPIERFMHTTPEQDAEAIAQLLNDRSADNQSFYGPTNTCRDYSDEKFNQLQRQFGGQESSGPYRRPASHSPSLVRRILGFFMITTSTSTRGNINQ